MKKLRLGLRIRVLAAEAELTPAELAKATGIPIFTARKWLGDAPAEDTSVTVLVRLCAFFGCSAAFLTGMSDVRGTPPARSREPFYRRLIYFLSSKNRTLYGLMRSTALTETRLRAWQNGFEPLASDLCAVAEHLGVSPDELLR